MEDKTADRMPQRNAAGPKGRDILNFALALAREKKIESHSILEIVAEALGISLRKSAPEFRDADFRVEIDADSGDLRAFRRWRVLEEEELMTNPEAEVMMETAHKMREEQGLPPEIEPGEFVEESLPDPDFSKRAAVQSAKQNLNQRLREAERKMLETELLSRGEEVLSGNVQRVDRASGDAVVDVARVECLLAKEDMLPREMLKIGDRVQALIKKINTEGRWPHIRLTRKHPRFLAELFRRVVPEIEKGVLEIVHTVRDPGNRAKIAVKSNDPRVDPVGTCVGIRGSRVQVVTTELNGERIDIIPWDDDEVQFVIRALSPAQIAEIRVDEDQHAMDILVEKDNLAQAIGRGGVNVRLAADLTGWRLNLVSPEDYEEQQQQALEVKSGLFVERLDVDANVARTLFEEGFETMEQIAFVSRDEMLAIEGLTEEVVDELQRRARKWLEKEEEALRQKMLAADPGLIELEGVNDDILRALVKGGITTRDDLADLAIDELLEAAEVGDKESAASLIMAARAPILSGDVEWKPAELPPQPPESDETPSGEDETTAAQSSESGEESSSESESESETIVAQPSAFDETPSGESEATVAQPPESDEAPSGESETPAAQSSAEDSSQSPASSQQERAS